MAPVLLSIIIPMFNAAGTITECVESVKRQLTTGCEVIIIDDGSSDGCADIVRLAFEAELARGDIRLERISNSGPGEARNVGVRLAVGEYIGFLDSDDRYHPRFIESIRSILDQKRPDVVQFHLTRVTDLSQPSFVVRSHSHPPGTYRIEDIRLDVFKHHKWFPFTRVFRKNLLLENPFSRRKVFYEDLMTIPYIFLIDGLSVVLLDATLVFYNDSAASTTRNPTVHHIDTLTNIVLEMSRQERQLATEIFVVKAARGLVVLSQKSRIDSWGLAKIPEIVRELRLKAIFPHISWADRVFLMFPRIYTILEKVRQISS